MAKIAQPLVSTQLIYLATSDWESKKNITKTMINKLKLNTEKLINQSIFCTSFRKIEFIFFICLFRPSGCGPNGCEDTNQFKTCTAPNFTKFIEDAKKHLKQNLFAVTKQILH